MNAQKNTERQEKLVNLNIPTIGFEKVMPFNAFSMERAVTGWLMHFALLKSDEIKLDSVSLYISDLDVQQNRARVNAYLSQLPDAEIIDQHWRPTAQDIKQVEVVRFMQLSRVGNEAEITFVFFPIHSIVGDNISDSNSIQAQPVASLISDLNTHRSFLLSLFSRDT